MVEAAPPTCLRVRANAKGTPGYAIILLQLVLVFDMRRRKRTKSVRDKTAKSKREANVKDRQPRKDAPLEKPPLSQTRYCSGEKAMLLGIVAFDMFAVGLIVPLLTPFQRKLGANASQIGFLSSVYGSVQMFSAPLLGWLSDRVSRREVLFICILAGAFGYGLLGIAQSLRMVLASRVIVGIARQTQTITKAWLSDLSTKETRLQDLSWFSATVSIGFMLGPTVGGKLAKWYDSYHVPFTVAFILFLLNSFLVRVVLPRKLLDSSSQVIPTEHVPSKTTPRTFLGQFASLEPGLRNLLLIRLLVAAGVMLGRNNLFNLLEYKQSLDVEEKGELISFFAIVSVLSQLLIIAPLSRNFNVQPKYMLLLFSFLTSLGFTGLAFSSTKVSFMLCLGFVAVCSSAVRVSMSTLLTQAARKDAYGEVLGVAGSVSSLCRAIAPLIGGVLIDVYDNAAIPTLVASCFCLGVTLFGFVLI